MKSLLVILLSCFSLNYAAADTSTIYYAQEHSCSELNAILYSQGHLRVAAGYDDENFLTWEKVYNVYTWDTRPQCVSILGFETAWADFIVTSATGRCELGYLCVENP